MTTSQPPDTTPDTTPDAPSGRPVVAITGLTKHYRGRTVVDDLTFELPRGVVAGFIGPNGAGKTTTLAMLLGLVRPTAGSGRVLGQPLDQPAAYLGRVGALVEEPALWPALDAVQNLRVLARLGGHDDRRIPELLELVGLDDRAEDRFGEYSMGMRQRLAIAAALLGDPELLLLDEPTNGLDPIGMREMRALIRNIASRDRTVLVSSHLLGELEQVCDWLLVIDRGRLVHDGPFDGFGADLDTTVALAPHDPDHLQALTEVVATTGHEVGRQGEVLVVATNGVGGRDLAADLNRAAATAGIVLAEVHVRRPNLEANYLDLLAGVDR